MDWGGSDGPHRDSCPSTSYGDALFEDMQHRGNER